MFFSKRNELLVRMNQYIITYAAQLLLCKVEFTNAGIFKLVLICSRISYIENMHASLIFYIHSILKYKVMLSKCS